MREHPWASVHAALGVLATICEWPRRRDWRPATSADAAIGTYLATLPVEDWCHHHFVVAVELLRAYRHRGIVDVDNLVDTTSAVGIDASRDAVQHEVRKDRAERELQRRYRETFVRLDAGGLLMSALDEPELNASAKRIPGRRFDEETLFDHRYPMSSIAEVVEFADQIGVPVEPEVREELEIARTNPALYANQTVTLQDDVLIVRADYDEHLLEGLRTINRRRKTWDPQRRVHVISPHADPEALSRLFAALSITVDPPAAARLDYLAAYPEAITYSEPERRIRQPRKPRRS